jgi:hypothetical protein
MATYSNNTTIKFRQGVTLIDNASYTIPAGCYGIISWIIVSGPLDNGFGGGSASVKLDGFTIVSQSNGVPSNPDDGAVQIYVPEGKVITTEESGKGSAYALVTVFQNTP